MFSLFLLKVDIYLPIHISCFQSFVCILVFFSKYIWYMVSINITWKQYFIWEKIFHSMLEGVDTRVLNVPADLILFQVFLDCIKYMYLVNIIPWNRKRKSIGKHVHKLCKLKATNQVWPRKIFRHMWWKLELNRSHALVKYTYSFYHCHYNAISN